MAKFTLSYSDGMYSTRPLTNEEAAKLTDAGHGEIVHEVMDQVYDAWIAHCNQAQVFQTLWSNMANLRYERQDVIHEYTNLRYERQDAIHEYTCIYPQPGCNIAALDAEWQYRAQQLLADYKQGDGRSKYQGCCCGNDHRKLTDEEVTQLRAAGFIVEHDSEAY